MELSTLPWPTRTYRPLFYPPFFLDLSRLELRMPMDLDIQVPWYFQKGQAPGEAGPAERPRNMGPSCQLLQFIGCLFSVGGLRF